MVSEAGVTRKGARQSNLGTEIVSQIEWPLHTLKSLGTHDPLNQGVCSLALAQMAHGCVGPIHTD